MVTKRKGAEASASHPSASTKKSKKPSASSDGEGGNGWMTEPPALIYKCDNVPESEKVACFDFDGTLVNLKSGAEFPVTAEDWAFFNPKVPSVVQKLHKDGYKIVVLANQGFIKGALGGKAAEKAEARMDAALEALGVPVAVFVATQGDLRKPATGLWDCMCSRSKVQPDKSQSFFVGDAAGRPGDADSTDKEFAENVGLDFKLPEQVFGEHENAELCACFDELALLMKAKGERYKARAFDKVSGTLATEAGKITSGKQARALPNVGKASADLIDEYLQTGKMQELEDLRAEVGGAEKSEKGVKLGKGEKAGEGKVQGKGKQAKRTANRQVGAHSQKDSHKGESKSGHKQEEEEAVRAQGDDNEAHDGQIGEGKSESQSEQSG